MSVWNYASSVESIINVGTGVQLLDDSVADFFQAALDEAKVQYAKTPIEGAKYHKVRNVDKNNYSSRTVGGIGLAKLNSDVADLPVDKQVIGFDSLISNHVLRNSMVIGREVLETDRMGVIGEHARNLIHSGTKTIERILADSFNRGFGTTALSMLGEDGLAMFHDTHPQYRGAAGTWDNLFTAGALTADSVAAARLAFNVYLDGNGDLDPQMLKNVIVPPELADTMREISGTTLKVDTSLNTTNVVSGIPYDVYHWLDSDTIIYQGDGDNGLEFHIRKNPEVKTYNDGTNCDKIISRVRMAVGTGLKRPGAWIGQLTA